MSTSPDFSRPVRSPSVMCCTRLDGPFRCVGGIVLRAVSRSQGRPEQTSAVDKHAKRVGKSCGIICGYIMHRDADELGIALWTTPHECTADMICDRPCELRARVHKHQRNQ